MQTSAPYLPRVRVRRLPKLGRAGWWLIALIAGVSLWVGGVAACQAAAHIIRTFGS